MKMYFKFLNMGIFQPAMRFVYRLGTWSAGFAESFLLNPEMTYELLWHWTLDRSKLETSKTLQKSKGKNGYPWEGTRSQLFPNITPYCPIQPLYDPYIGGTQLFPFKKVLMIFSWSQKRG